MVAPLLDKFQHKPAHYLYDQLFDLYIDQSILQFYNLHYSLTLTCYTNVEMVERYSPPSFPDILKGARDYSDVETRVVGLIGIAK